MVDKVTQANRKIAQASSKMAQGPVGAKMIEMLDVPSFAKGLTPSMLFDLAKDKGIITKEQQADFSKRVGKDRRALAEFNKIVTEADQPNLAYKGQSPLQIELLRSKNLLPATAINKTERIDDLKKANEILNDAVKMDAPKEVKEQTFLDNMRKAFGDFADNPTIRKIARGALMILNGIPTAVDFIPMSLLEQTLGTMDGSKEIKAAKGGMMNINDITKPVGYDVGGIVPKKKPEKELTYEEVVKMLKADKTSAKEPTGFYKFLADAYPVDPINKTIDELKALGIQFSKKGSK